MSGEDKFSGYEIKGLPSVGGLPSSQSGRVVALRDSNNEDYNGPAAAAAEDDDSPLAILLQFIPYYGQGDPANDSTVRSALSVMSVEEIDSKDSYGNTLLLLACQYHAEDLAKIILNKGANPSALNSGGSSCLHFVCYKETSSYTVAKALLNNGANPEVQEHTTGATPLIYAAQTGDINMCKLLLQHDASINTLDYSNYSCVDHAKWENKHECAAFLEDRLNKFKMESMRSVGSMYGMPGIGNGVYGGMNVNAYAAMGGYGGVGYGMGGMGMGGGMNGYVGAPYAGIVASPPGMPPTFNAAEWQEQLDPASQTKYYTNLRTAESLWEHDYLVKASAGRPTPLPPSHAPTSSSTAGSSGNNNPGGTMISTMASNNRLNAGNGVGPGSLGTMGGIRHSFYNQHPALKAEADLEVESFKLRVMTFFNKHAANRMGETGALLEKYKGNEFDLLRDLCKEYGVALDPEIAAYHVTLKEVQTEHLNKASSTQPGMMNAPKLDIAAANMNMSAPSMRSSMTSPTHAGAGGGMTNPMSMQQPGVDHSVVEQLLSVLRAEKDAQLEEERIKNRKALAEKEGELGGIKSELDALRREKASAVEAKAQLEEAKARSSLEGGEALAKSEEEITKLHELNANLKNKQSELNLELIDAREKLQSAEHMLSNMASGHEETIAREKKASEDRATQMREVEEKHVEALRDLEGMIKANDIRAKYEMTQAKSAWDKKETEMRSAHEAANKALEEGMQTLEREMTALKTKTAKELSEKTQEVDDVKKSNEELLRRAEFAEAQARSLQNEVAEARAIQAYNAQLHKDLAREQLARKRLHNEMEDMKGKIRVYVRIRPFSNNERSRGCTEAVTKDGKLSVLVRGANGPDSKKNYDFDQVFAGIESNTQADVFRDTKHLMLSVIDGYNVCIFAYGQTGAGKSFTMIGSGDISECIRENGEFDEMAGITPRAVSELFRLLNERQAQVSTEVEVQMFQLYRDGLDDLLVGGLKKKRKDDTDDSDRPILKITLAEHSPTGLVQVEGACSLIAENPGDVVRIFAKGAERRTTASTQMNAESSRSHLICCLVVKLTNRRTGNETIGKLTLVDLAGSERVDKSGAAGEVLKEAQSINKSLSALGDVIAALTSGQQHVPYRNHPLTMLMSDSLGGNAKTLMFVNCSPADYNVSESNSSLGFASRCKDITNSVAAGPGVQAAQMMALKKELAKLKKGKDGKLPPIK